MDLFQIDTVGQVGLLNENKNKNVEKIYFESIRPTENVADKGHTAADNNDDEDSENEYDYFGEWIQQFLYELETGKSCSN